MRQRVFASCTLALAVVLVFIDFFLACLAAYAGAALLLSASSIAGRRRVFLHWALALSAVWLVLNAPHDLGGLKSFLGWWAGFPWTFAHGHDWRIREFDPLALLGDVAVGAAVVVGLAGLCALSRRSAPRETPDQAPHQTSAASADSGARTP
jgi:hypothetical protein